MGGLDDDSRGRLDEGRQGAGGLLGGRGGASRANTSGKDDNQHEEE